MVRCDGGVVMVRDGGEGEEDEQDNRWWGWVRVGLVWGCGCGEWDEVGFWVWEIWVWG